MNKKTLVFATNNVHKLKEVQGMIDNFHLLNLAEINCFVSIPETADTLVGNARLKADFITENYHMDAFADDTGLEVVALNNAPGVYSARYAGEQNDPKLNMEKLLRALKNQSNRSARFKTVIALNIDGKQHIFEGVCKGTILNQARGKQGFGYDPVFQPDGHDKTFAEMDLNQKSKISHRGKAVQKLIEFLNNYKN